MDMIRLSWEATIGFCEELAGKIGYKPDIIIGLSRGGLVPCRILSDIIGVDTVGVLGIRFYKGMGRSAEFPQITQELTMELQDKKVLIVDDVADTGRSLMIAKDYLMRKGASDIKVATLHYKPNSQYRPDYFVKMTTSWIAYPWEVHEMERELGGSK